MHLYIFYNIYNILKKNKKNTLFRVIPTMTFQNNLLTPLLSEAFDRGVGVRQGTLGVDDRS